MKKDTVIGATAILGLAAAVLLQHQQVGLAVACTGKTRSRPIRGALGGQRSARPA